MEHESVPLTGKAHRRRSALLATLAVALWELASNQAWACPFCYAAFASAKAGVLQALRSGMLILILPSLAIFAAILAVARRSRHRYWEAHGPGCHQAPFDYWEEDRG